MSNRQTTWELKAVDNLPDLIARMQKIADLMQQQQQLSATSTGAISGQLTKLSTDYANLQKQIAGQNTEMQKSVTISQQTRQETERIRQQFEAMKTTTTSLTTLMAGVFSAAKTKEFLGEVIEANTRVSLFGRTLETMLQNKQQADEIAAYALNLSQRSPFEVKDIIEVTQRLIAMGAESGKVTTYLEMLGELSAVVGNQKLPLIAKALLDVQNKQKLYAQEVRQFTDNGIPLYQLLADSMDLPIAKVKKMAEQHEISFAQVEKALLEATQEGGKYYGMMALQAESLGGKLSNLKDVVFLAKARFGEFVKEGLMNAITWTTDLVKSMTSSNAAMEKTVTVIKAVTTLVLTFTSAMRAGAAAVVAKEVALKAVSVATGTYNLAMITITGSTQSFTRAQIASATAARSTWAVLSANPIGALLTVVGLATSAYFAWEASIIDTNDAQTKLNDRLTEAKAPLELARTQFNELAKAVLTGKMTVEEKATALEKLRKKYPELLVNVTTLSQAEEWLNLNGKNVNTQLDYRQKKFDELKEKYPQQLEGIDNLADAELKLGKLMKEVNNDFLIRIKLLENEVRTQVNNEAATAAVREKIKLENELAKAKSATTVVGMDGAVIELKSVAEINRGIQERINALERTIVKSQQFNENIAFQSERLAKQVNAAWDTVDEQVRKENERWEKVAAKMKVGTKEYEKAYQAHVHTLEKIKGEELTNFGKGEDGKKAKALLTATEIDEIRKRITANATQDLDDRMKLIDKEANVQIAAVNKMKISRQQAEKEITVILQTAQDTKTKLYRDEYAVLSQFKELDKKETFNDLTDQNLFHAAKLREKEKNEREYYHAIEQMRKEANENFEKAADITAKASAKSFNEAISQIGGGLGKIYGMLSGEALQGLKTIDVDLKNQMANMQTAMDMAKSVFGENSRQYQSAHLEQSKLTLESAKASAELHKATLQQGIGVAQAIEESLRKVVDIVLKFKQESTRLALEVLETVQRVTDAFYKMYADTYKQRIDEALKDEKLSYKERIEAAEKFQKRMNEVLDQNDLIQQTTEKSKLLVQISNESFNEIGSGIKKLFNPLTATQGLVEIFNSFKNHNARIEQMNRQLDLQKAQQNVSRIQNEIETETAIYEAKMQFYADDLEAFTKLKNDKIKEWEDAKETNLKFYQDELDASQKRYDKEAALAKDAYDKGVKAAKAAQDKKIEDARDAFDTYKQQYADDVDAVKDAYSKQIDALREKQDIEKQMIQDFYDQKAAMLEQSTADETSKVEILDRVRLEALQRYEADETKKLQDARDRILLTLTDEKEKQDVINSYAQKILDVHNQVEEAKLDKSKGVKLATTQLNNEGKEEAIRLKNEEKTELTALDDKYQEQFKKLAEERDTKLAEMDAANRKREQEQKDELRRIDNEYDADIRALNKKYDDDLAALKQTQTDRDIVTNGKILKLETDTAAAIAKLKQDIADKDAETKTQMLNAQNEYAKFMRKQNGDLFEAQKQMAVAELQVAKAQIAAKKGLFGYTKAQREAMNEIDAQIANILGQNNPYYAGNILDTIPTNLAELAKTHATGKVIADSNSDPANFASGPNQKGADAHERPMGRILADDGNEMLYYEIDSINGQTMYRTKQAFFAGTPYIEGLGYPDGRDTVPAMVNKGERIMQTHLNQLIGGKGVTNEELVAKKLFADKVLGRVADIRGMLKHDTFLAPLPEAMLKGSGSGLEAFADKLAIMASGGAANIEELAEKIAAQINKPSVHINVTPRGMSVKEKGQQQQNETYYNNTPYKNRLP